MVSKNTVNGSPVKLKLNWTRLVIPVRQHGFFLLIIVERKAQTNHACSENQPSSIKMAYDSLVSGVST